ncbi:NAD+ synthase [Methanobacterium sp. ACI-7]|uniref:NAD+ synthase n=1 Tax=unclassified Methanobacterium TaxID=2627676 RepID=UPI0039C4DD5E
MQNRIIPELDMEKSVNNICDFIKNKVCEIGADGLVIGLSGGIDSSVVAYLCSRAVGNDKVLGLVLPSKTTSSEDIEDAIKVARELKLKYKTLHIDELMEPFTEICFECSENALANGNLKARMRMMILYYHSNAMNRIVAGTGNRTELLVGYFTKYGDGGVDILPIGDLYKTDVREIAAYLEIPKSIIEKPPTAGLWTGQTDEKELGIKYENLDKILYLMIDEGLNTQEVSKKLEISEKEIMRIKKMIESSKHKLELPPIAKIR